MLRDLLPSSERESVCVCVFVVTFFVAASVGTADAVSPRLSPASRVPSQARPRGGGVRGVRRTKKERKKQPKRRMQDGRGTARHASGTPRRGSASPTWSRKERKKTIQPNEGWTSTQGHHLHEQDFGSTPRNFLSSPAPGFRLLARWGSVHHGDTLCNR